MVNTVALNTISSKLTFGLGSLVVDDETEGARGAAGAAGAAVFC